MGFFLTTLVDQTVRVRSLFWLLVWAFNLVGFADLVMDTARASSIDLPSMAGQLGAGYAIPILYVPALFWMHLLALWLLLRPAGASIRSAHAPRSLAATEWPRKAAPVAIAEPVDWSLRGCGPPLREGAAH
jgi:hypothetical protein